MKKILLLLSVLLLLSSCNAKPRVGPPWMQELMQQGPKGSSTVFQLGWRHGCETGISGTSNRLQRSFYKFTQDYELSRNAEYYTAWKTAYSYCQRYVFQYLRRDFL